MTDYKKLYEDAIFRMNKWVEGSEIIDPKEVAEFVFPELAESEDERTRKEIIDFVKSRGGFKGEWIAWLEKHGEKLPVGFYYVDSNGNKYFSDTFKNGDFTFHVEKGEQIHANFAKTCKDEQKNADKVEPKFKVGDWIYHNKVGVYPILITDYDEELGYQTECLSTKTYFRKEFVEKEYHLWTIEDAKDGDVIATKYFIFIFKNIDSNNGVHYYCQYEIIKYEDDNQFDTALPESLMGKVGSTNYSPATKEQRDTLMKAMTDAGYTFDFEKKELKKIEQKPAWSEEDDETVLNNLIYALANDIIGNCRDEYVDWLKSLKGRILKFEK